jgi:hypothetical protein
VTAINPDVDDEITVLRTMRTQYLGALKVLAECSILLRSGADSDDMRACIEDVLDDARKVIPQLRWKRILHRFEIELVNEDER